jgi:16S rRNA (guanine966-N2)-methyltransferase
MRIVAGEWGGRRLDAPRSQHTRPTADRVREALFSMLGDVEGEVVLDLFAGTGALALEALSRGAARALCVENGRAALAALRTNVARLNAGPRVDIVPRDAHVYRPPDPCDLVLADPPWAEADRLVERLEARTADLVAPGGRLVLERAARDRPPPPLPGLEGPRVRRYGDTLLALYDAVARRRRVD